MAEEKKELQESQSSLSKRFTDKIIAEFSASVSGAFQVTDYQRQLIQGYFICIDRALKNAEDERVAKNKRNKNHDYDNNLPFTWNNVNMTDLSLDLVNFARIGLDMLQDNMLFPIPYKNDKKGKYDITLMEGYNGVRYIAEKYAIEVPLAVTVEVVYSTDEFIPLKKGNNQKVESYEFHIKNPFDRGTIVGGFAYLEFRESSKNELIMMSIKDIEKRKPKYASASFWGGKQKVWKDGQQVEEESDGWLDEMVRKTLIREAFSAKHLPRDPRKIDESYQYTRDREARYMELEVNNEIAQNANSIPIDVTPADTEPVQTKEEIISEFASYQQESTPKEEPSGADF